MATFESPHYALQKSARANTSRKAPGNVSSGAVEYALIPYTLAGTEDEATSDVINLCLLPKDVIPVPELSKVVCSADPGSALVLDLGTAADPDGWGRGLTLSSGGTVECLAGASGLPAWFTTKTPLAADAGSGNAAVYATVVTGTTLTAGVVLHFILAYKRGKGA